MLFGKVMLVRLVQLRKQASPNDVMLFGKVMLVMLVHFWKQLSAAEVTVKFSVLYSIYCGIVMLPESSVSAL